jgi:prephenate dehydrogenase
MTLVSFLPKTITIYSVGLLGGSLGLALKTSGYKGRIIGLSSPSAIKTALELGCIDEGYSYDALADVVKRTDCLFLCSPINAIISTIEKLGTLDLPKGMLITDVGSTKKRIMDAAQKYLPAHVRFIGGHPMAGSEKQGPSAADPYLFQNAIYVLTQGNLSLEEDIDGFASFLGQYLGCRHVALAPDVHDTIAATVSHVPHLLAVALVNVADAINKKVPGTLQLAAGGFRDMTRIASAPYSMWHDILFTNKECINPIIDEFIDVLHGMKNQLNDNGLQAEFDAAAHTRSQISSSQKGFLHPLNDVYVVVKDQPGMIALMANACAHAKINIKDIEVLKVRENEAGTIRLAFESSDIAKQAVQLLKGLGITAWERE